MRRWIALSLALCAPPAYGDEVLGPAAAVERILAACAKDSYLVTLREREVLRGFIEQGNIDVVVRVIAPNGVELARTTRAADPGPRTERFLAVAPRSGEYRLEVTAADGSATPYRLERFASSESVPADLDLMAGHMLLEDHRTARDPAAGIEMLLEAVSLCRYGGGADCEAEALQALAHVYWRSGRDLQEGRKYLRESLRLREQQGDRPAERSVLNDLGVLSRDIGELLEARDYFERLVAIPSPSGVDPIHYNNMAPVYLQLGELQRALDMQRLSLAGFTRNGDAVGMGYALVVLGKIHLHLGEPAEALRLHQDALARWTEIGWHGGIAESQLNVGVDQEALGQRANALKAYRSALRSFELEQHPVGQARALMRIAALRLGDGDTDAALEAYESAVALLEGTGYDDAQATRGIGDVHAARGDEEQALAWYARALKAQMESEDRLSQLETEVRIAAVEARRENFAVAAESLDRATGALEVLRFRLVSPDQRASYLAARQAAWDLSIDTRMRMHQNDPGRGHDRAALEISERGRARALLDIVPLARTAGETGIDPHLIARERELRSRISAKEAALRKDRARAALIRDELETLLAEYRGLDAEIMRADPRFAHLLAGEPATTGQIQLQLERGDLLLEYSLGDERSWVWVVTADAVFSAALPGRKEIEDAAARVSDLLPRTRKRELQAQARRAMTRLSDLVLGPVAPHLKNRRLVIVADGALQTIPFAALPDPRAPEEPLLARHEVVSLPSASLIAALRRFERAPAAMSVAVVADPVLSSDDPRVAKAETPSPMSHDLVRSLADFPDAPLERLRYTRKEAAAIAALLPPERRLEVLDFAASRAMATGGALSGYRIVHFAAHGLINERHPELSGLVLSLVDRNGESQDGFLRLLDIYKLRLDADLVVLSACRTALGKDLRREGLVGLARGFMHAGSPRVVASLWDVRDAGTAELMKRFYTGLLKDGLRPAAALRAAQLSLRAEARWSAPVYWGGFVLQGEWR